MNIDINEIVSEFERMNRALNGRERDRAVVNAINRGVTAGKTAGHRKIIKTYALNKKFLQRNMKVKYAKFREPQARIYAFGTPLDIKQHFPTRQTRRGVTVRIRKGHSENIKNAVIRKRGARGKDRVFARGWYSFSGRGFYYNQEARATRLVTLSQGAMMAQPEVIDVMYNRIKEMVPRRLTHEMGRIVAGLGGRRTPSI